MSMLVAGAMRPPPAWAPMTTGPDPRLQITLRQAWELYYKPYLEEEAVPSTVEAHHYHLLMFERYTNNPTIDQLDDLTFANWKAACLAAGYRPATINTAWRTLHAIMRRLAPQFHGNPRGFGILTGRIPYMKLLKENLGRPRIAHLDELSRFWEAAEFAEWPRSKAAGRAAQWWRSWICVLFNFGPRLNDLIALRTADVSLETRLVTFRAQKTGKLHCLPMSDVVLAHVRRQYSAGREFLFERARSTGPLYAEWHRLQDVAKIEPHLEFQTLRKTCNSYINRVAPGMGAVVLGHSLSSVNETYYSNWLDTGALGETLAKLPQPEAFLKLLDEPPEPPRAPPPKRAEWSWTDNGKHHNYRRYSVRFRTQEFTLTETPLRCLRLFLAAGKPLSVADVRRGAFRDFPEATDKTVEDAVWQLRRGLMRGLQLPPNRPPIVFDKQRRYVFNVS